MGQSERRADAVMTLDPEHRRIDAVEDAERRRAEDRGREARRLWVRERGRVKRIWMLPLLVTVFIVATLPVGIVGSLGGAPLVSVAATVAWVAVAVALYRLPYESPIWAMGPIGEPTGAEWLEPLLDVGFVVVLERTIPPPLTGLLTPVPRSDIHSLAIGPTGFYLIAPVGWRGTAVMRKGRLFIGDSDRTTEVEAVRDKAALVAASLDEGLPQRIPVTPVICAAGGGVGSAATTQGVHITDGSALGRWLTDQPAMFDGETVVQIAGLADRRLPRRDPWATGT